jgi:predicted O-methyltransferase YrrM
MNYINLDFSPALANLLKGGRIEGAGGKIFNNTGAVSSLNTLWILRTVMMDLKPGRTLEIGLSFGGSCLVFLASHRDLSHSPEKQHIAIDPHQKSVWDNTGLMHIRKESLQGWLDFYEEHSSARLPMLVNANNKIDLVYIDGSHLFEDVFTDFYYVWRLLATNGVVIFDDYTDPHVKKVTRFIDKNLGNYFSRFDVDKYRPDQGRSCKYKIAKMLNKTQVIAYRKTGNDSRSWNSKFMDF